MDHFTDYQTSVPSLHHIVNRHTHRSWCVRREPRPFHNMMLVIGGEGVAWTNGLKTELHAGMLVYHPVEEEFGYETSQTNYLHCMGGNFSLSALEPGYHRLPPREVTGLPLPTYSTPVSLDWLTHLFSKLALAWGQGMNNHTLRCRSLFMMILDELTLSQMGKFEDQEQLKRIHQVAQYMEAHYERKMTLHQLAELAGLTPSYFGQVFRKVIGVSPVQFLHSVRIHHAIQWMELGYPLSEVAGKVGFTDPFYFSRVFKKKQGISPSEYMNYTAYI